MSSSEEKKTKGHCPDCGAGRWADIMAKHKEEFTATKTDFWYEYELRVLKCRGCESVYVQRHEESSFSFVLVENTTTGEEEYIQQPIVTHWPPPTRRKKPVWISTNSLLAEQNLTDPDLRLLLAEVYEALNADLRVLAAIGIRTSFDRASELLGISPGLSFGAKLAALQKAGHIGTKEIEILDALTDAGSAAAHRGWRPTAVEINTMMEIIEGFLYRSFILGNEAKKLKQVVPKRLPKPTKN